MDEIYDIIILGTGLTECVLSGISSSNNEQKVLHMDRNKYYGGEATSLNLTDLHSRFGMNYDATKFTQPKQWNVDVIPKFLMADGKLVKILIKTGVTKYMEFKVADGSYSMREGKVQKVPSTAKEALTSSLLGILEKRRVKKFLEFVQGYDPEEKDTCKGFDASKTMEELYTSFGINPDSQSFIGHAMALHHDDEYLKCPCVETIARIQLYYKSLLRYGGSPYLYPLYGLGELPQGFARLSAVYGGTYMLNKPIDSVTVSGDYVLVESEGETVKGKKVLGDPSYFPNDVTDAGKVIRVICILSAPIPNTNNHASCQLIIPQKELCHNSDIYILCVSSPHNICEAGKYVAIASTKVDDGDDKDKALQKIKPGLDLLGPIEQRFVTLYELKKPKEDRPHKDKIFISKSYDASCHFETTCDDITDLYRQIYGKEYDFSKIEKEEESQCEE